MFRKSEKNGCSFVVNVAAMIVFSIVISMTAIEANASIFYDDFEDGDYDGWLTSWQQGQWGGASGSWEVVDHITKMAYVTHKKSGFHSLAHDFAYADDKILSFDMQISGVTDGGNHAGGYVIFSFLSQFNVEIGSGYLGYSTNPALIPDAYEVDANPHNYSASMSEWADFAGITTTDQIATFSLTFKAWG